MVHAQKKQLDNRKKAVIAAVALFILVMIVVPRWRHATACTLTGGRWTSKNILPYLQTGCRVKSRTADKPCTGQLRNECDHSSCDLSRKGDAGGRGISGGGICPTYWVKNGYDNEGTFRSY